MLLRLDWPALERDCERCRDDRCVVALLLRDTLVALSPPKSTSSKTIVLPPSMTDAGNGMSCADAERYDLIDCAAPKDDGGGPYCDSVSSRRDRRLALLWWLLGAWLWRREVVLPFTDDGSGTLRAVWAAEGA